MIVVCAALLAVSQMSRAATPAEPTETVIRLTVPPKAAPKPALKYHLLPELAEMQPGNPIQGYLRCFSEQYNFFYNREAVLKREEYQKMPLASLPLKELKGYGRIALDQADYAARLTTPDWQMLPKMKVEGVRLLLPDLQGTRDLTRALKVRFRVAVAEKRFDDAIRTAKTMFALARHVGKHPTLIGNLVGMAIGNETLGPLEEMLQQPGCPNLYWAFADLPSPLVEIRWGIQGARILAASEFSLLKDREPMTDAELERAVKKVSEMYRAMELKFVDEDDKGKLTPREWLKAKAADAGRVRAARKRLAETGLDEKALPTYPALQIILLDEKREYEDRADEHTRGMLLPYWQGEAMLAKSRVRNKGDALYRPIVPSCRKVRGSQVRLEQRLALLRTIEALRLYAAAHAAGRLPDKLSELAVPVPVDPVTGKAFHYTKDGNKATLKGTPPLGAEKTPFFNPPYEITLQP
jgi:hypothetical protein